MSIKSLITDDMSQKMLEWWENGDSDSVIARRINMSDATVWGWRKRNGLKTNYQKGKERERPVWNVPDTDIVVAECKTVTDKKLAEKLCRQFGDRLMPRKGNKHGNIEHKKEMKLRAPAKS